ncbi:protein of unknown function (plasmid) [Cupriavidus neocaledonicus]|uniref:Uncharacterized protein n=1 Tax=Cupriavidus neocaledonicus TaxID=1040979 RepID=A0A375HN94_9BURK|nr:protein of unknown function [Cupriavidus neocaledonicus]
MRALAFCAFCPGHVAARLTSFNGALNGTLNGTLNGALNGALNCAQRVSTARMVSASSLATNLAT